MGLVRERAEVANAELHDSLNHLRTCLFFEQRLSPHAKHLAVAPSAITPQDVSMFEKFLPFVGLPELPNCFYPVADADVKEAEARMKLRIPSELRTFFAEVGCGFYCQGANDSERGRFLINGILGPGTIADLVCDKEDARRPQCRLKRGFIPVFDRGDRNYLLMNTFSERPNQVLWQDRSVMMDSFVEFMFRLHDHAGFYKGGPGTY